MVVLIFLAIVVGAVLIYGWIRLINRIFNPAIKKMERKRARLLKNDNPYIVAHRFKMQHDDMYQEYLQWLDKNGGDIPFEKWKTEEEQNFEQKIRN